MQPFQKIELRKMRDFSSKFNVTFEFIRQNYKALFSSLLFISVPFYIVGMMIMTYYQNFVLMDQVRGGNLEGNGGATLGFMGDMFSYFIISYCVIMLGYIMNVAVVYNLMRLYDEKINPLEITVSEVWNKVTKDIVKLIGAGILAAIMITVGFVVLIIPGIYLAFVLVLMMPIIVFERKSIGDALSRSFYLIKDKWWSTFGLLIIAGILQVIMGLIFNIPSYIFTFSVTMHRAQDFTMDPPMWQKVGLILSSGLSAVGVGLVGCVSFIALAFQYFNLVERREASGLIGRLDTIGRQDQPSIDPKETY